MILDSIGNTPMIKLDGINVKLEYLNPSGSVKDRIAKYIVRRAEKAGQLKRNYTIIEATSGNTGIAFSLIAAVKGYKMIAVMPKGLSKERAEIMRALGAKVIYVNKDCFDCAIDKVLKLGRKKRTYLPKQFKNPWNIEDHEEYMGKEILKQANSIDAFVAGVGTGGTLIGVGKALRKKFPRAKLFAVEPKECHLIASSGIGPIYGSNVTGNVCRHHKIEGIGDGIIPDIIRNNREMIDGIIEITSAEAIDEMKKLAKRGYFVGPSSGANFLAAKKLKKKYKNIVTLFPDRGDRYLSEGYF